MQRIGRFGVTGVTATLLNLLLLWLLVAKLGAWYLPASVFAFSLSLGGNFLLQKVWTFGAARRGKSAIQLAQFIIFNLLAMLLNTVILYVAVESLGVSYLVGQLGCSAVLATMSYCAYRWIFRSNEEMSLC